MLTQSIIKKEFALSGSEQNPDLTGKSWLMTVKRATNKGAPAPVEAFKSHGVDFIVRDNLADLVERHERAQRRQSAEARTHQDARSRRATARSTNPYVKDAQVMNIHNARRYIGDRLIRTAKPHRILDPAQGPLIAVKLNILTRKTLGGFETDLDFARVRQRRRRSCRGSTPPAKPPVSAAAACTAIARWKGRFSAAACFPGRNAGRAAAKAAG